MSFLREPLQIGASELKNVIGYLHCDALHIRSDTFLGPKWKMRYAIISKGCLYIYVNMHSKKPERAYPLITCKSASACDKDDGGVAGFSFRLFENDKKPLLFSCDTAKSRENWLENIRTAISETHPSLSADSGYGGSASSVPGTNYGNESLQTDSYMYADDINRWKQQKEPMSIQECHSNGSLQTDSYMYADDINRWMKQKESMSIQEFNTSAQSIPHTGATVPKTLDLPERDFHSPGAESEFGSVRSGLQSLSWGDSVSMLSVRGQERGIRNTDSDNSSEEDSSPTEIIYENPEELVKKFAREDYYRDTKKRVKKVMRGTPEGTFVVYPGEEAKLTLCVMTPKGLKYFRINEQGERVSLFKDFSRAPNVFSTLESLLFHYHYHDLPGDGYSVKLKKKKSVV